ncbi:OTU deubiquitinase with linear linkage specificity a [Centropristis striata]|uniref:OTU deubiquitinase with linear linkage specificity a n=1 Tax=Centropristis striata TaxID=184440 RepID=UPI0027E07360|nr:OTU deubiquitinase with linear linkage specificity a [Centropristis striata]
MSWVKAVSNSVDVFDENGDELSLQNKEWTANMKKRVRDGYVDGIDAGEDASLQAGFNMGYREGAAKTVAVGRLRGIVSAICCWCQIQHPESPVPASVTNLLQRVSRYEETIMEGIRQALENPPPSVSSVSESMEDLEVQPADSGCCGGEGCKDADCCSKGGERMDLDAPQQQQKLSPGSSDCSPSSNESFSQLLQRCIDLVLELGLPQELISHIQELENM